MSRSQPLWIARTVALGLLVAVIVAGGSFESRAQDVLASWRDGAARQQIIDFVGTVTDPDSPDFVPPADRIATFDNDGTLWVEKPTYVQLAFVAQRVRELAPENPGWATTQPFQTVLEQNQAGLGDVSYEELMTLIVATHTGMSQEAFETEAQGFLEVERHPRFNVRYTDLVYQPMLELMDYLRANEFRVFIVSGGGVDFIRSFSEPVYGVLAEDVVGSSLTYTFIDRPDGMFVMRDIGVGAISDREGKPTNIALHIGRRPVIAVGNSDGDMEMLQYATGGPGPGLAVLVHHDDPVREYAYDRGTEHALEVAAEQGWTLVSMREDFETVFEVEVAD